MLRMDINHLFDVLWTVKPICYKSETSSPIEIGAQNSAFYSLSVCRGQWLPGIGCYGDLVNIRHIVQSLEFVIQNNGDKSFYVRGGCYLLFSYYSITMTFMVLIT